MKPIASLFACSAGLLLPSCIFHAHTADRLRDPYTTYTGADIYHPVDGKIHYTPKEAQKSFISEGYVVANEVTFTRKSKVMNTDNFYPGDDAAENFKPTGRQLVVKINAAGYQETLPALPKGLMSMPAPTTDEERYTGQGVLYEWAPEGDPNITHIDDYGEAVETQPGWWRRRAIDCCDYFVDPVLTFTYNTLFWGVGIPVGLVVTPVVAPVNILCAQQQQQQETQQQETQQKEEHTEPAR